MRKYILITTLLFVCYQTSISQSTERFLKVLPTLKGKERIDCMIEIAKLHNYKNADSTIYYCKIINQEATKLGYKHATALSLLALNPESDSLRFQNVKRAIRMGEELKMEAPRPEQLKIILDKMEHPNSRSVKIALPTMEGLQMINIDSIITCEANDNYTTLMLKNNRKLVVSCTLKTIEELLEDHSFIRVHRSYLVNLNEIEKYVKADGGYLVMSDGEEIYISRNKKDELLKKLVSGKE